MSPDVPAQVFGGLPFEQYLEVEVYDVVVMEVLDSPGVKWFRQQKDAGHSTCISVA